MISTSRTGKTVIVRGYLVPAIFILGLLQSGVASAQNGIGDRISGSHAATRSVVMARNGIAATSHPLATQVALDILQKGGTAVDAAIAANAMLGLLEPNNCGIGGDLFAIVWDGTQLHGLNASGRSPAGLSLDQLRSRLGDRSTISLYGPTSVSVPGAVDGWFELHGRFGRMPMAELLDPSIHYAREGVPMAQVIAFSWAQAWDRLVENEADIGDLDNFRKTFLVDGAMPGEGEVFRNPDLAATYEAIARGGRDIFYSGSLADRIDAYARRVGMLLRKSDLQSHRSTWVEPVSVNYRGYDVYELPPNGQGIAALQMLNILEGYDLASLGHNSADHLHLLIEAKKLAFEDRARLYADPEFYRTPLETLLSDEYAEQRRAVIRMDRAMDSIDIPELREGDTVYLTVADSSGMIISLIQSNMLEFGSGLVPDGMGFVLQNRGSQFSLDPSHPNAYEPGKRPFHTIIPAFVMKDGQPFLSFGVMGGAFQPQGHVQVLVNIIDFGMNIQEAGDAPRISHSGSSQPTGTFMIGGGRVAFESQISQEVQLELARRGHRIAPTDFFGGYQAILWDAANGVYHGASDMRKDGHAAGF